MSKALTFTSREEAEAKLAEINSALGLPRKNQTPGVQQWVLDAGVTVTADEVRKHPDRDEYAICCTAEVETKLVKSDQSRLSVLDATWKKPDSLMLAEAVEAEAEAVIKK